MLTRGHDARYSPTGHLVFGRDGALWAVSFDSERLAIAGDPVQVIPQIVTLRTGAVQFGLSTNGTLAYLTEGTPAETRLGWVDRHGEMTEVVLDEVVRRSPRLSPDDTQVAFAERSPGGRVWRYQLPAGPATLV